MSAHVHRNKQAYYHVYVSLIPRWALCQTVEIDILPTMNNVNYRSTMFDVQYDPGDFDVLLTDVHSNELHHEISSMLGTSYLEDAESGPVIETRGIVWGPHNRVFVATVVKMGSRAKHVHFLIDTGSPFTYLCDEVLQSFGKTVSNPHNPFSVHVNGMPVLVLLSPENRHFKDINILGTDFMKTFKCVLKVDFGEETVTLTTGEI